MKDEKIVNIETVSEKENDEMEVMVVEKKSFLSKVKEGFEKHGKTIGLVAVGAVAVTGICFVVKALTGCETDIDVNPEDIVNSLGDDVEVTEF